MTKILYVPEGRYLSFFRFPNATEEFPNDDDDDDYLFKTPKKLIEYICKYPCNFHTYNNIPTECVEEEFEIIND